MVRAVNIHRRKVDTNGDAPAFAQIRSEITVGVCDGPGGHSQVFRHLFQRELNEDNPQI
jgi:hypothetical protein